MPYDTCYKNAGFEFSIRVEGTEELQILVFNVESSLAFFQQFTKLTDCETEFYLATKLLDIGEYIIMIVGNSDADTWIERRFLMLE